MAAVSRSGVLPRAAPRPLVEVYDTALLDLDGVVYTGQDAIEHAVPTLAEARERGMALAYVTNNAARPPRAVAEHLVELGIPCAMQDVITSAQAAARMTAERVDAGSAVLVVGGAGLVEALRERGLRPVRSADEDPSAVVQGYARDVDWRQLAEASYAIRRGAVWVASNADLTIPTARGIAPGNGALVEVVRIATGAEPWVAGKPRPPMHRETVLRTGAQRPLVVGDRLDTDIEGAQQGDVPSLLVFTGVTEPRQAVLARPEHRPSYLAADLRGLLTPHPEVFDDDAGYHCGGWTARTRECALQLSGAGDSWDGLRALCAAGWAAVDASDGEPPDGVDAALRRLGW